MGTQQGNDKLIVVLDMTDTVAPKFLVYDGAGHLLGGIRDVTVHTSVDRDTYAEVVFHVENVQIIGEFANIQTEPGLSVDVDSRGNMIMQKHDYRYLTSPNIVTTVDVVPDFHPYQVMRTLLTVDSAGHQIARQQGAREFADDGDWKWEDI